jgi:hypothetical protein
MRLGLIGRKKGFIALSWIRIMINVSLFLIETSL